MVKLILNFILILFLFSEASYSQQLQALASVDTTDYFVGDYINYVIRIEDSLGAEILHPALADSLKEIEIISEEAPLIVEKDGKKVSTFKYILSKYDSADVIIPQIPITYSLPNDTTRYLALSNSVSFTVHTMQISAEEDIKDVKDPLTIPLDWRLVALIILGGLIILGLLIYYYKKYKKKKAGQPVVKRTPKILPHVIALQELELLEAKQLWQKGLIKEYHSEITEIIRKYFEKRFDLHALEMTTGEVIDQLRNREGGDKILDTTYNFLSNADLVKFAKYQPMDSVNEQMMRQGKEIVESTIPSRQIEEVSDV
jgi:hypothetical protein